MSGAALGLGGLSPRDAGVRARDAQAGERPFPVPFSGSAPTSPSQARVRVPDTDGADWWRRNGASFALALRATSSRSGSRSITSRVVDAR